MTELSAPVKARVDLTLLKANNRALHHELEDNLAFLRRQCRLLEIELKGTETAREMRTLINTETSRLLRLVSAGAVKFPNRKRR